MLSVFAQAQVSSSGGMLSEQAVIDVTEAAVVSQAGGKVALNIGGYLPNACYSWSHLELTHNQFVHYAKAVADVAPVICTQAEIEFSKTIVLSGLTSGNHSIIFLNRTVPALEVKVTIQ